MLTDSATNNKSQKPFFVNQFVNTVYGIILGTGIVDSAGQIEGAIAAGNSDGVFKCNL